MGEIQVHLLIITICVFFLWVGFISAILYGFYIVIWKPMEAERLSKAERARRIADRRG